MGNSADTARACRRGAAVIPSRAAAVIPAPARATAIALVRGRRRGDRARHAQVALRGKRRGLTGIE